MRTLTRATALALAVGFALAGCIAPASRVQPAALDVPGGGSLVAYQGGALVPVPASAAQLAVKVLKVGQRGAEPTLGVTRDGAIYVTGGSAAVWKSADRGATWANVASPIPRPDVDPYLWVDPKTDRIFSAPDNIACSNLMWSDDGGKSWAWMPAGGCGLPGHDHQSLVTGPPPQGISTMGYPDVVYYSYNSVRSEAPLAQQLGQDGTWVDASLDGGLTWSLGARVLPSDGCEDGLNGAPAVAPDGTVFVPMPRCDGLHVGVSKDAGKTWKVGAITGVGTLGSDDPKGPGLLGATNPFSPNPGMGVDAAGNAFVAFAGHDGRMYLARSTDDGATWSQPLVVSAPGISGTAYSALVAGAAGKVAIAYLGTNASTTDWQGHAAQWASPETRWHLYLTLVADASSQAPTVTSLRVTPQDDPVQIGCIWQGGGSNPCRNLGDFLGMAQRDGRVYVVYSDGCDKCASADQSRRADLTVVAEDTGPSLAGDAPLAPYGGSG
jgi:hypothetical protein